jgi:hypothetical protein
MGDSEKGEGEMGVRVVSFAVERAVEQVWWSSPCHVIGTSLVKWCVCVKAGANFRTWCNASRTYSEVCVFGGVCILVFQPRRGWEFPFPRFYLLVRHCPCPFHLSYITPSSSTPTVKVIDWLVFDFWKSPLVTNGGGEMLFTWVIVQCTNCWNRVVPSESIHTPGLFPCCVALQHEILCHWSTHNTH